MFSQHTNRTPSQSNQQGKKASELERSTIIFICYCTDMILHLENPPDSIHTHTHKKPIRIYEFSRVAGYKVTIQKSDAFLQTNNKQFEKEVTKTIPFTVTLKRL